MQIGSKPIQLVSRLIDYVTLLALDLRTIQIFFCFCLKVINKFQFYFLSWAESALGVGCGFAVWIAARLKYFLYLGSLNNPCNGWCVEYGFAFILPTPYFSACAATNFVFNSKSATKSHAIERKEHNWHWPGASVGSRSCRGGRRQAGTGIASHDAGGTVGACGA